MLHLNLPFLLLCSFILQTANLNYSPGYALFNQGEKYIDRLNEECGKIAMGEQTNTVIMICPYLFYV